MTGKKSTLILFLLIAAALILGFLICGRRGIRIANYFLTRKSEDLYRASSFRQIACTRDADGSDFLVSWGEDTYTCRMEKEGNELHFIWSSRFDVTGTWNEYTKSFSPSDAVTGAIAPSTESTQRMLCYPLARAYYDVTEARGNHLLIWGILAVLLALPMILIPEKMVTLGWEIRYMSEPEPAEYVVKFERILGWILFGAGWLILSGLLSLAGL